MKKLRKIIVATAISLLSTQMVEARINTTNLTCHQTQNLVNSSGAIVLSTGRYTYDRFVANRSLCSGGDYIKRVYVSTRDRKSCPVRYVCTPDNPSPFSDD